jgi:uncharacterized membrane protein
MAPTDRSASTTPRHLRDTNEFARAVNLSDAVFAIAMTLLVLTIDVPDVPASDLPAALLEDLPQLGAYALAFALVASLWHTHHKLFHRLAWVDVGLITTDLVFLGLVALVPYPTSVLGSYPTSTAAVAPFLGLFVVLNLAYLLMIVRAQAVEAWSEPLPPAVFRRVVQGSLAATAVIALGIIVSLWLPLLALAMGATSSAPYVLAMRRTPARYRAWI